MRNRLAERTNSNRSVTRMNQCREQWIICSTTGVLLNSAPRTARFFWLPPTPEGSKCAARVAGHGASRGAGLAVEDTFLDFLGSERKAVERVIKACPQQPRKECRIAALAPSDTLARSLLPVVRALAGAGHETRAFYSPLDQEGAALVFAEAGLDSHPLSIRKLASWRPRAIIMCNDWSNDSAALCKLGRLLGWTSICVQESVIDFAPSDMRMRRADLPFFQGVRSALLCRRRFSFITGNPRYESIVATPMDPKMPVMINCNFTYGIQEEHRHPWLSAVSDSLRKIKVPFFISQHPRDPADVRCYGDVVRSNASVVHDQIRQCSCVVSRFSSLLFEAALSGRPAIYFNPHGENMLYDFRTSGSQAVRICSDVRDLEVTIERLLSSPPQVGDVLADLDEHLFLPPERSSVLLASLVGQVAAVALESDSRATWRDVRSYFRAVRQEARRGEGTP